MKVVGDRHSAFCNYQDHGQDTGMLTWAVSPSKDRCFNVMHTCTRGLKNLYNKIEQIQDTESRIKGECIEGLFNSVLFHRFRIDKLVTVTKTACILVVTDLFNPLTETHMKTTDFHVPEYKRYALKIYKQSQEIGGLEEISVLRYLNFILDKQFNGIIEIHSDFYFQQHLCIVLELLDFSLYEAIQSSKNHKNISQDNLIFSFLDNFSNRSPIEKQIHQSIFRRSFQMLNLMKHVSFHLLMSLHFLQKSNLIHSDIKPENIMFANDFEKIKLIDFGNAVSVSFLQTHYKQASNSEKKVILQSLPYRAPEVLLGNECPGVAIDIWSLGCVLFELCTREPLFNFAKFKHNGISKEEFENYWRSMEMINGIKWADDEKFLGWKMDELFGKNKMLKLVERKINLRNKTSAHCNEIEERKEEMQLFTEIKGRIVASLHMYSNDKESEVEYIDCNAESEWDSFVKMLIGMLKCETEKRLVAWKGLFHPFLNDYADQLYTVNCL